MRCLYAVLNNDGYFAYFDFNTTMKRFFVQWLPALLMVMILSTMGFGQITKERSVKVQLRQIVDADISITPFNGLKAVTPIEEIKALKNNETATFLIPEKYIPGEFVLRINYRAKESDAPYPSERYIYLFKQDIVLSINPPYINDNDSTKFSNGEMENTIYAAFTKENILRRSQLELLRQLLLNYDSLKSAFYLKAVNEFEQRRLEYNNWLGKQSKAYHDLYISRLFQFRYIPAIIWTEDKDAQMLRFAKNYFEGIDFSDTLILPSRELNQFMSDYMSLYGMLSTTSELRDSLFTMAGSIACEKASEGHPKVYGWMTDYFYNGYETYSINKGMVMLQKHMNNPNCLTSKKQQINKRLAGVKDLIPGSLAPDFVLPVNADDNFNFHKWKSKAPYKLLLFWSADCAHCLLFVNELKQWYSIPENKKKLDIIAVSLDATDSEIQKWTAVKIEFSGWQHLRAKEGVNSPVANSYSILSTPAMYLVKNENNIIKAVPLDMNQLKEGIKE
jgi:hypothetical protein